MGPCIEPGPFGLGIICGPIGPFGPIGGPFNGGPFILGDPFIIMPWPCMLGMGGPPKISVND